MGKLYFSLRTLVIVLAIEHWASFASDHVKAGEDLVQVSPLGLQVLPLGQPDRSGQGWKRGAYVL